jgi:hypothetical protein
MAYTFRNPLYSLVQFGATLPLQTLPVALASDLAFQFFVDFDTETDANAAEAADPATLQLILLSGSDNTPTTFFTNKLIDYSLANYFFDKYRLSATSILYTWKNGLPGFDTGITGQPKHVDCEECFQLIVVGSVGNTAIALFSNDFVRVCDTEYTSVLKYRCNENSYQFNYCEDEQFFNSVRLPLHLLKPQYEDDEVLNNLSNGETDILKSVTRQTFEGGTDWLNKYMHERIKIALSHDVVNIAGEEYSGGIRKNGNYEIEWQDVKRLRDAPASFKVYTTPYLVRNSNCVNC